MEDKEFEAYISGFVDDAIKSNSVLMYKEPVLYNLKHISELNIGDEILVNIPTVMCITAKVSFINIEKQFVFINEIDDEGINILPDRNGFFKVPC